MSDEETAPRSMPSDPSTSASSAGPSTEIVNQVFGLFKDYLSNTLDEKEKILEGKVKVDKEASTIKFKGNRKQFELNAKLDSIFAQIEGSRELLESKRLAAEARELIRKRQKLIKLADKSKDGWLVVQEYESDELASNSEDEKRIRKAKTSVEKKRKSEKHDTKGYAKRSKSTSHYDNQLFRGKVFYIIS